MAVVKGRESIGSRLFDAGNYAFLLVLAVTFIYPFWTMLIDSFSTPALLVAQLLDHHHDHSRPGLP